jgi:probable HAF family extracellular repeat protein
MKTATFTRTILFGTIAMLSAAAPLRAVTYSITDLGVLPGQNTQSYAYGINNLGEVTGYGTGPSSPSGNTAFVWKPGTGMQSIGVPASGTLTQGFDINDAGQVTGNSLVSGGNVAFLYTPGGGFTTLGTLASQFASVGYGLNNAGAVAGFSRSSLFSPTNAVLSTGGGNFSAIPGFSGTPTTAYDINNSGIVTGAGILGTSPQVGHAFTYNPATGVAADLGTIGANTNVSVGYGISDGGQVTGYAQVGGANRAFLYTPGLGMVNLGSLTSNFETTGYAVNNAGQVLGFSGNSDQKPFLYTPGVGMQDLRALIQTTGPLTGSSFSIHSEGNAINDWGQIVGDSTVNGNLTHAMLLIPLTPLTTASNGGASLNVKFVRGTDFSAISFPVDPIANSFHSEVKLLSGTAGVNRDVTSAFGIGIGAQFASDVVSLTGTGTDTFTLQLSYDEAAAVSIFGAENLVRLGWRDPAGSVWKNATIGNTGAGALAGFYAQSYTDFLAAHGGTFNPATMLGAAGVDSVNNTAWAVLNHNSDFAIATPAPEPTTAALLLGGAGLLLARRRRVA